MKTRTDFEPDLSLPTSIRDMVIGQISYGTYDGKTSNPFEKESLDDLMKKVFAHIESESLRLYRSNEPWAIREYVIQHIFHQPVASEDNLRIASEFSKPVEQWQQDNFDPIQNFRLRLEVAGRKRGYIREVLTTAKWFVADYGRKQRYTESEILQFLRKLSMRYTKKDEQGNVILEGVNNSTYVTRCTQFKQFLSSLPEDDNSGRKQRIPFELPTFPSEFNQPVFSNQDIESIIYTALIDEKPEVTLRILLGTVYGARVGEIAEMDSSNINLDDMTIKIPTEKKGQRKPQPIPEMLKPIFSVQLEKDDTRVVVRQLKRICRKAGIDYSKGTGIHAIRRSVVTSLYSVPNLKELSIRRFMRWALDMGMGVMPRYVKTPLETTDLEVLEVHPYVKVWEELLPFIEYLPQWAELEPRLQFNKKVEKQD